MKIPTDGSTKTSNQLFSWGNVSGQRFIEGVNDAYEKIVFWRVNLFLLPTGSAGKRFIREIIKLINHWLNKSPLKDMSLKAIMVMPALLLQKPSKNSKKSKTTWPYLIEGWLSGRMVA